jgi:hypothetical protein
MAYSNQVELPRELLYMASTFHTWIYMKVVKNLVHRVASESELAEKPLAHPPFPSPPLPAEVLHYLYIKEKGCTQFYQVIIKFSKSRT